jgi:hypothetical protein
MKEEYRDLLKKIKEKNIPLYCIYSTPRIFFSGEQEVYSLFPEQKTAMHGPYDSVDETSFNAKNRRA